MLDCRCWIAGLGIGVGRSFLGLVAGKLSSGGIRERPAHHQHLGKARRPAPAGRHSRDMFWQTQWGGSQPERARARRIRMQIELPDPFPATGSYPGASADCDREQNRRDGADARPAGACIFGACIFGSRLTHFGEPVFAPARDSPASGRLRPKIFLRQLGYNLGFLYIQ